MGQMANLLTERQPGSLPSNSEVNPRRDGNEHVKAVTLRSGKDLETKEKPSVTEEVEAEKVIQPSQSDDTNKEQLKEKQSEISIILGRPFLATGRAMIDVQRGELKLRVQDDEVKFNVFEAVRHPAESDTCFMAEMVEAIVSSQSGLTDPLETSLVENESENLSEEAEEYVKWMDSFGHNRWKY